MPLKQIDLLAEKSWQLLAFKTIKPQKKSSFEDLC